MSGERGYTGIIWCRALQGSAKDISAAGSRACPPIFPAAGSVEIMEENPHNRDFGILTDIAVVTRDLQPAEISATEEKVEKVKISVDVMGKKGSLFAAEETEEPPGGAGGGPQDRPAPGDLRHTRAEEIRRYLSAYCNLPVDKVYVTILP